MRGMRGYLLTIDAQRAITGGMARWGFFSFLSCLVRALHKAHAALWTVCSKAVRRAANCGRDMGGKGSCENEALGGGLGAMREPKERRVSW